MKPDLTKLYIPMIVDGFSYSITVEIENPQHEHPTYVATGPFFVDLAVSPAGFGMCMEDAVIDLIGQYEGYRKSLKNTIFSP